MANSSGNEPPAKRSKIEKNLGFKLTSLRGGSSIQNQYAVSLSTILAGDFTEAILTNYSLDVPWLFGQSKRLSQVPVLLVHGSHHPKIVDECKEYPLVKAIAPPLPIPYGSHHTKMAILFFPTFVRVSIFTANFVSNDWDCKTQAVWSREFPCKSSSRSTSCDFETDLLDYMSKLNSSVGALCIRNFPLYDFSSAGVAIVASVPGIYQSPSDMEKYGHLRMKKLLRQHNYQHNDHPIISQFSSWGSLDEKWLAEFYNSMTGQSKSNIPIHPSKFHCIWPSVNDVRNSNEGWQAGRSLPCSLKNMKPFLHKYLRKWHPPDILLRQNAMPHMKSYASIDTSSSKLDYVLMTSANLSKAAWGALQKGNTQYIIRSYELGLLFLPSYGNQLHLLYSQSIENGLHFPLPFQWPPTRYNTKEEEPWIWDLERSEVDVFGETYEV